MPGQRGRIAVGNVWCLNERTACVVRVRLTGGSVALGAARLRVPARTRRRVRVRLSRHARALLAAKVALRAGA